MPADSKVKHHLPPNGFAPDGRRSVGRRAGDTPVELLPPKVRGEQDDRASLQGQCKLRLTNGRVEMYHGKSSGARAQGRWAEGKC